ncbi:unnamed protein product, partial [Ixodes hexagonus]
RHIKDKRTAEAHQSRTKRHTESSSPNGAILNSKALWPVQSAAGLTTSASSSTETHGPLSASTSALPGRNFKSPSPERRSPRFNEEPIFYSRTTLQSDVDDRPTTMRIRNRRPRRDSYYRHERSSSQPPANFQPQPGYPHPMMQNAANAAGVYPDPTMCAGSMNMFAAGGMPMGWGMPTAGGMPMGGGMPLAGGMFPPQGGAGYQPYGMMGPRPRMGRMPRGRGSQGDARRTTVRVNTPRAHLSVSASSSTSGEYY